MKETIPDTCKADCAVICDLTRRYRSFASKVSHEIRNPLTLVYSSLQLIEKDYPDLPKSDLWGQVKQDIQDTIVLLKDLSSFGNTFSVNPALIDLSDFLSSVAAACRPSFASEGIRFSLHIPEALPPLYADTVKLRQALLNLLRNAEDALTEQGSGNPDKQILLSAQYDGQRIHLHVRDNGTGILPEYMDTLFDPFVSHKRTGTGLGLGIVKNVAESHGGSVSISTSTAPRSSYTDVCISIPALRP